MADQKKMKSGTFHSDPGQMDQDENDESNSSCDELHAESPAQIGKDETPCESIYQCLQKNCPPPNIEKILVQVQDIVVQTLKKQSEAPRFVPASTIQEVT